MHSILIASLVRLMCFICCAAAVGLGEFPILVVSLLRCHPVVAQVEMLVNFFV